MTGHWSGNSATNRKDELPDDWAQVRREILDRDGGRCVENLPSGTRCSNLATDVDHVGSKWDNSPANLRSLCGPHHAKKTAKDAAQEAARLRATPPRRKQQKHPSTGWR